MFASTLSGALSCNFRYLPSSSLQTKIFFPVPKTFRLPLLPISDSGVRRLSLVISSSTVRDRKPIGRSVKTIAAGIVILTVVTSRMLLGRTYSARAEAPHCSVTLQRSAAEAGGDVLVEYKTDDAPLPSNSVNSISDCVITLRSLLYQKLEKGEDLEALSILRLLMVKQPIEAEWKLLAARLLNEMGKAEESRHLLNELLEADPVSVEALFQNAVLMERCGEGLAAIEQLNQALDLARAEHGEALARDILLIMAQIHYLQRNVEAALTIYNELAMKDPKDYRPFFCLGMIYTLLNRNNEAREKLAVYNELTQKKAEVNAYMQTPLSRVKLFSTEDS